MKPNTSTLSDVMDFDHVIEVHDGGTVQPSPLYAPDVHMNPDLSIAITPGWSLLNGYSGQDSYSGPVMHDSEFIGGGMARDILAEPGTYVAVVVYCDPDDDDDVDTDGMPIAGWAVARWDGE